MECRPLHAAETLDTSGQVGLNAGKPSLRAAWCPPQCGLCSGRLSLRRAAPELLSVPQDLEPFIAVEEDAFYHCARGAPAPWNPLFHSRGAGEEEDAAGGRWLWALRQVGGCRRAVPVLGRAAVFCRDSCHLPGVFGCLGWQALLPCHIWMRDCRRGPLTLNIAPQTLAGGQCPPPFTPHHRKIWCPDGLRLGRAAALFLVPVISQAPPVSVQNGGGHCHHTLPS